MAGETVDACAIEAIPPMATKASQPPENTDNEKAAFSM